MSKTNDSLDHLLELGRKAGLECERNDLARAEDDSQPVVQFEVDGNEGVETVTASLTEKTDSEKEQVMFSKPIWVFPEDSLDNIPKEVFMSVLKLNKLYYDAYVTLGYGTDTIHLQALESRPLNNLDSDDVVSILNDITALYSEIQETFGLNQ